MQDIHIFSAPPVFAAAGILVQISNRSTHRINAEYLTVCVAFYCHIGTEKLYRGFILTLLLPKPLFFNWNLKLSQIQNAEVNSQISKCILVFSSFIPFNLKSPCTKNDLAEIGKLAGFGF